MKKSLVLICLLCMACCMTACSTSQNSSDHTEEITKQTTEVATQIQVTTVSKEIHTPLEQKITMQRQKYLQTKKNGTFFKACFYFDDLCNDENVKRVEYILDDCVGGFMTEGPELNDIYKNDFSELVLDNQRYVVDGSNQANLYFTIILHFDNNNNSLSESEQTIAIQDEIKKARLCLNIEYKDGTTTTKQYGMDFPSQTNSRQLFLYEIS